MTPHPLLDSLLMMALALNFVALGVSRLRGVIYAVALQGALFGLLPLLTHAEVGLRTLALVVAVIALKGILIPYMLIYAMRETDIRHEVTPLVDFIPSLLIGAVGTGLVMLYADTLPLVESPHSESLLVPTSLSTVLVGFLLLTTRKMAINQVLGYLVLENGIFAFGMLLLEAMPLLVEVGILLDLFTAVFVMGIIIYHINREFDSVSTEYLSELKE
jgi:hydrogenase-4 component E